MLFCNYLINIHEITAIRPRDLDYIGDVTKLMRFSILLYPATYSDMELCFIITFFYAMYVFYNLKYKRARLNGRYVSF